MLIFFSTGSEIPKTAPKKFDAYRICGSHNGHTWAIAGCLIFAGREKSGPSVPEPEDAILTPTQLAFGFDGLVYFVVEHEEAKTSVED